MRKSKLPLKKFYTFVSHFLKRVGPNRQAKKKGRPQKYEDALIITLWLFQILNKYSYRETLEKAKDESFDVPSLCDYHYRVRQLDEKLQMFGSIKQKICSSFKLLREDLARKASIACVVLWNFYLLATYRVWLKCLG
jgi:hypothetical protein